MVKLPLFYVHGQRVQISVLFGVAVLQKIITSVLLSLSLHAIICYTTRGQIAVNLRFWNAT